MEDPRRGDYSYLVEGENEAAAIDTGYGAGNIREFLQTLTNKPVRNVINTHSHFDHTPDGIALLDRKERLLFTDDEFKAPTARPSMTVSVPIPAAAAPSERGLADLPWPISAG